LDWLCRAAVTARWRSISERGNDPASYPDDVKALWDDLLADWNRFCEKPSWLLDELRDPASSPDPSTVLKE